MIIREIKNPPIVAAKNASPLGETPVANMQTKPMKLNN